jgi:hypothetical protein
MFLLAEVLTPEAGFFGGVGLGVGMAYQYFKNGRSSNYGERIASLEANVKGLSIQMKEGFDGLEAAIKELSP